MNELQSRLLEIMKWFHNFCVDNNLKYYMLGGTMLGAIRHKGFIPWDDDMDVGMPRKDYMKFIKLTSELKHNDFLVESMYNSKDDYIYPLCKVYDKRTTLIENLRWPIKRGIYIDIFPLDIIMNNRKKIKTTFIFNRFLLTQRCAIRHGRKWYKNLAVLITRILPNNKRIIKRKNLKLDLRIQKMNVINGSLIANFYGAWEEKEIVPVDIFGTPTLYTFEKILLFGPANYDAYLKALYGNYMLLPPPEKRKSHHDYLCLDIDKAYLP